jgi:quercetin dioxygenase-like cupin family protein
MGFVEFQEKEPDDPHTGDSGVEFFRGDALRIARIALEGGSEVETHRHPEEQLVYVLQGLVEATVDGQTFRVGPGEASYHPSDVIHGLTVLEDSLVLSFKVVDRPPEGS